MDTFAAITQHLQKEKVRAAIIAGSFLFGAALMAVIGRAADPADRSGEITDRNQQRRALELQYLSYSAAAMSRMMEQMATAPSGDADIDFVAQMIPHHQGAVEMATALLSTGRNEPLRRLAHEIIITQKAEIAVMQRAIQVAPTLRLQNSTH